MAQRYHCRPSEFFHTDCLDWSIDLAVLDAGIDADTEELRRARSRQGDGYVEALPEGAETELQRAIKRREERRAAKKAAR